MICWEIKAGILEDCKKKKKNAPKVEIRWDQIKEKEREEGREREKASKEGRKERKISHSPKVQRWKSS